MDIMMKIGKTLTIFLIVAGFFACSDDDNSVPFDVIGDVYVIKRNIDNEWKYAIGYAAYGNQPMSFAKVSVPEEITLTPTDETNYTWNKIPTTAEYTNVIPTSTNYQFLVVNEDINHDATDLLEFDNIDSTQIKSTTFTIEGLNVEWESNTLGEGYRVLLVDGENVVFRSQPLPEEQKKLIFDNPTASGIWTETPTIGQDYSLELHTYRYENDAISEEYNHQIQEIVVSKTTITWE